MNSLVVFLSMVALAVAKPSGLLAYSAPAIAAIPAAVSHQSRIDIKSSPAFVATAAVAPIAHTVIAEPAIVAPAAIAAPAAVSHQSRIDIKSSPALVSDVVATPFAAIAPAVVKTAIAAPVAYAAPTVIKSAIAGPAIAAFAAPSLAVPTTYAAHIAAPAALATPALISPSVPLDTPEVVAARAAHFEAKAQAIAEQHSIHKRSAPLFAAPALTYAASPLISTYATAPVVHSAPLIHSAPLAYSTPILSAPLVAKAYGVHPW